MDSPKPQDRHEAADFGSPAPTGPRRQERSSVEGIRLLSALFRCADGREVETNIVDATSSGLAAVAFRPDAPYLGPGTPVEVSIRLGSRREPIRVDAEIRHCATEDHLPRYGVEFVAPDCLGEFLPSHALKRIFNRRVSHRIAFDPDLHIAASIGIAEGGCFEGRILDVSAGGLLAELDLLDASDLGDADLLEVEFTLPGEPLVMKVRARIRDRRPTGARTQLGLEIDSEHTPLFDFKRDALLDYVARQTAMGMMARGR